MIRIKVYKLSQLITAAILTLLVIAAIIVGAVSISNNRRDEAENTSAAMAQIGEPAALSLRTSLCSAGRQRYWNTMRRNFWRRSFRFSLAPCRLQRRGRVRMCRISRSAFVWRLKIFEKNISTRKKRTSPAC